MARASQRAAAASDLIVPDADWYARDPRTVAPELLGAVLTVASPQGDVAIRLTEVEAYAGSEDPGSHAFRGQTARNATMFGPGGHLYVYFTYGMHHSANLVTGVAGSATGILMRAGEVVDGLDLARSRRTTSRRDADLASGPGRLAKAVGLTREQDGIAVGEGGRPDGFAVALAVPPEPLTGWRQGPRTGVSGEGGDGERFPWRYWLPGEASVSRYRRA